ncbi:tetratricopeptide repeat protein [Kutzneria buriramensis]|uniref:tetratricopeptide repeat protein n=1 Tax=Kutzneria buriramensis TaxID=1045776 RepID=UPI0011C0E81B|nr:tetratricopeptide repeat protein [Kutzneria buriramensis]
MGDRVPSLQELIRRRQAGGFVGRVEQLAQFKANLALPDELRRFVFSVHGSAGVGKTFLVRQFVRMARDREVLTGYVDESAYDVFTAVEAVVADLAGQGGRCREFPGLLEEYRQRRHELESDPAVPEEVSSALTRTVARVGLRVAGDIPVVGAVAKEIDGDTVARQLDRARAFLGRKFRSQEDVRLILTPVEVLTSAFVRDLSAIAASRPIALFFDTYERTGSFLDAWLLDLLAGRYGALPGNLIFVVAGQRPLDANRWGEYLPVRTDFPLEIFTDAEARQLLATHGVTDPQVVEVILELSGRLPVWVATLVSTRPDSADDVGDPSGSAVERFLKWETDPLRRAAARHGALPRQVDRDVLAVVDPDADHFDWLTRLPFVVEHATSYRYHDVVRTAMLRVLRRDSPTEWQRLHRALAEHYGAAKDALGLTRRDNVESKAWQLLALEERYHDLCGRTTAALPAALCALVDAIGWNSSLVPSWLQTIKQAGRDAGSMEITARAEELGDGKDLVDLLTQLLAGPGLDLEHRMIALAERGSEYREGDRCEDSVRDLSAAVAIHAANAFELKHSWVFGYRGETYQKMKRFDEAIADFNKAVELNPKYQWAFAMRGETYRIMKRFDDAIADFNKAVELNPKYGWAYGSRGQAYQATGRNDEAIADFTRAIECTPNYAWAFAMRGETYRLMKRYNEALTDFDKAIEHDPMFAWPVVGRGVTHRSLERHEEAIAEFTRAIELFPEYSWAFVERGETYHKTTRTAEAIADFTKAIELTPDYYRAFVRRGRTYGWLGRHEEALADFNKAIELAPESSWAITSRGWTLRQMGQYVRALADFNGAIELNPDYAWAISGRGQVHRLMNQHHEALTDLNRAIELNPSDGFASYESGLALQGLDRPDEAKRRIRSAIEHDRETLRNNPRATYQAFNIAVYLIALGETMEGRTQLEQNLRQGVSTHAVRVAIGDFRELEEFSGQDLSEFIELLTSYL